MDDPGLNRDMSGAGRGGFSSRGGYHQGGYRGGSHGPGVGGLGRGGDPAQGEHIHHGPGSITMAFKPAPEFEMKGNDFPALPGLDETRKVSSSESSEGGGAK